MDRDDMGAARRGWDEWGSPLQKEIDVDHDSAVDGAIEGRHCSPPFEGGTGEHCAEKIAAEVARVLGISHATVELAEFRGERQKQRGSASKSFVSDDEELVHGNQVLEWTVGGYDPNVRFGQSDPLERLTDLRDGLVSEIVNRVPSDWMSQSAREFAINLITFNRNQLMELSR